MAQAATLSIENQRQRLARSQKRAVTAIDLQPMPNISTIEASKRGTARKHQQIVEHKTRVGYRESAAGERYEE